MSDDALIDLAAARTGGRVIVANDEFFAPKENLLRAEPAVFIEGKYTDHGKWMDGWETRRRRTPGHDWCILRLGLPGRVDRVTFDTAHFRGNHPEAASLEGLSLASEQDEATLAENGAADSDAWHPLVPQTTLVGHHQNQAQVAAGIDRERTTHVRLSIFPDGGVARLRVWGRVMPDWPTILAGGKPIDLLAVEHGGRPLTSSDAFFSRPINLTMPGRGRDMGDGWETRRRRGPGHDWVVLELGQRGTLDEVLVDTRHFKGNYPDRCWLAGCDVAAGDNPPDDPDAWMPIVDSVPLGPDAEHRFSTRAHPPVTHVRFVMAPDGGVSRLRLYGQPSSCEP